MNWFYGSIAFLAIYDREITEAESEALRDYVLDLFGL